MKNSEILKNILIKITSIEKRLLLSNYQQTLILKKLNESEDKTVLPEPTVTAPGKAVSPDPTPEESYNDYQEKKNKFMSISRKDAYDNTNILEENTNTNELSGKNELRKFPVIQKIKFSNSKTSEITATVKDFNGKKIKEVKANSSGVWQVMLPLGKYIVEVSGKIDKEPVSYTQSFEVMETESPILIPVPQVYKRI